MIFDHEPATWQELQLLVARAFNEMGCVAEVEKDISTVRGGVNIDVYVVDKMSSPTITYLCECKYWSKPVSKATVHGLRTVVNDFGANLGLIISSKGFQSGALRAAKNSNVRLFTWTQFQQEFENRWTDEMCRRLAFEVQSISTYINHPSQALTFPGPGKQTTEFLLQWKSCFMGAIPILGIWVGETNAVLEGHHVRTIHPDDTSTETEKIRWVTFDSKRQFFDLMLSRANKCRQKFESLVGPLPPRKSERIY